MALGLAYSFSLIPFTLFRNGKSWGTYFPDIMWSLTRRGLFPNQIRGLKHHGWIQEVAKRPSVRKRAVAISSIHISYLISQFVSTLILLRFCELILRSNGSEFRLYLLLGFSQTKSKLKFELKTNELKLALWALPIDRSGDRPETYLREPSTSLADRFDYAWKNTGVNTNWRDWRDFRYFDAIVQIDEKVVKV